MTAVAMCTRVYLCFTTANDIPFAECNYFQSPFEGGISWTVQIFLSLIIPLPVHLSLFLPVLLYCVAILSCYMPYIMYIRRIFNQRTSKNELLLRVRLRICFEARKN